MKLITDISMRAERAEAMKTERFNELVYEIRKASIDTLTKKNEKYSTIDDRLHNFHAGAVITGLTAAQTAWGYMAKHLVSLQGKILSDDFSDMDDLKEKIQDSINYLVFIWCCANESIDNIPAKRLDSVSNLI